MGLWQSRDAFLKAAQEHLYMTGIYIRQCGRALAKEGPAELSGASNVLGKCGRVFKQASKAISDGKFEEALKRINLAAHLIRAAGLQFQFSGHYGGNFIECAKSLHQSLEHRALHRLKMDYLFAGIELRFASRKLHCAAAEAKLYEAARTLEKIGCQWEEKKVSDL